MAKSDFIPHGDPLFLLWHDQFKTALTADLTTFGLVAADAAQVNADNGNVHTRFTTATAAAATAKQAHADKNSSRAAAEKHARALARRIKAHPAYTLALGQQLGIIGPEDTTDLSTLAPHLSGEDKGGGVVELTFTVATSEGVNIYSRREGDTEFKFLARDTTPPCIDSRPLLAAGKPELRKYKAVFVRRDQEVSPCSDEITVNCTPLV